MLSSHTSYVCYPYWASFNGFTQINVLLSKKALTPRNYCFKQKNRTNTMETGEPERFIVTFFIIRLSLVRIKLVRVSAASRLLFNYGKHIGSKVFDGIKRNSLQPSLSLQRRKRNTKTKK